MAYPWYLPYEFRHIGVSPRDPLRSDFYGVVLTHPATEKVVIELVYDDRKDEGWDSDIYAIDVPG